MHSNSKKYKFNYLWIVIVLILVIIDQLIKFAILKYLGDSNIVIIKNVLELSYVENTGIAFGLRFWKQDTIDNIKYCSNFNISLHLVI